MKRRPTYPAPGPARDRRNEYKRAYYARNKEVIRAQNKPFRQQRTARLKGGGNRRYDIKKQYGITIEIWNKIFEDQGSVCAACGSPIPEAKNWQTDHDHELGLVRGILCYPCNRIAGRNKDHMIRMRLVLAFLETFYGQRCS